MLGFASIGELTFGGLGHAGAVIIVTGNAVTISQGSPYYCYGEAIVDCYRKYCYSQSKCQMASRLLLQRMSIQRVMSLQFLLAQRM